MTRRVLSLALVALLLLTLSGSISADDPAPAEIVWLGTDPPHFKFPWFDKQGNLVLYALNVMRVFAHDRNGNLLLTVDGTIDYEAYATIEQACDSYQTWFAIDDPCNREREGAVSLSGRSTCLPTKSQVIGQITYNWEAVFTPSGNVRIHCEFTPGSEVPPQQCME
jgi:hypothetical protein